VPLALLVSAMLGALPLHIAVAAGVAVIVGVGLIVTTAVVVAVQPLAVPVIVYVAVPDVLLLLLLNACAIEAPTPALPPLIPADCATLQVYVVPDTVLVSAMPGVPPLQIVTLAGVAVITGAGFTVIITVLDAVQVLALPTIV
jgi:hypothetical protein